MTEKVLIVDDDPNLLAACKRQMRKFDLSTAEGGIEALKMVKEEGPFAVVVCDMRMPKMTGVEVLASLRKFAPNTVRMMLTGNADQQTAVDAINDGAIFRFFTKPCPPEVLTGAIEAGIEQYRLVTAEHDLLEKTLTGSVKVMVDILSMTNPEAFGQAEKVREWAVKLTSAMGVKMPWKLKLAALLAPVGQVAIPLELMTKIRKGEKLTEVEAGIIARYPETSRALIANVPRLQEVAEVVFYHTKCYDGAGFPKGSRAGRDIPLEARILKVLYDLAAICPGPNPTGRQLAELAARKGHYDPAILARAKESLMVSDARAAEVSGTAMEVAVSMLTRGDILRSDLVTAEDRLILATGSRLTDVQVERVKIFAAVNKLKEPVQIVRVPGAATA